MMVSQCQAKLLHQLTLLLRPRRVLEIGTFTGYSTIAMASALESAATITTLELDQRPLQIAHQYIQKAGLNDIVEMKQGPAIESLIQLTRERPNLQYDMIFLDADKGGYIQYYEHIMQHNLLSDRGCLLADNVLFFGQVHREAGYIDPQPVEASKNIKKTARKAHAFNAHVYSDPRAQVVVLPLFDGLSIIQKRKKD
ncbi:O-methyltransferase [Radiomyces spectabilis]|uniref:O-methyltransferase n=1 Tax=Radiomyces spectabilis TaxID=64574 RepID=UPI00221FAFE3|nr:O-methyltransferase [Radiomyces spectabilis]KAI8379188.1 O-methyltransferase [Radiomyces spectabilis]